MQNSKISHMGDTIYLIWLSVYQKICFSNAIGNNLIVDNIIISDIIFTFHLYDSHTSCNPLVMINRDGDVMFAYNIQNICDWNLVLGIWCTITLTRMTQDFLRNSQILIKVMPWCRQAASHYLNQGKVHDDVYVNKDLSIALNICALWFLWYVAIRPF